EENVLAMQDRHLVVRVSWVFGPDRPSFIDAMIKRAREEEEIDAVADKFSTPTYTRDIAEMLSRFFDVDVAGGILHFANSGQCSWQEYAQHALDCCHASVSDKTAYAHVKYQNTGTTPVHFKSVKASCGCTTTQTQKEMVNPGEKGEIVATFTIGDRTGQQIKTVTVQTDDPNPAQATSI